MNGVCAACMHVQPHARGGNPSWAALCGVPRSRPFSRLLLTIYIVGVASSINQKKKKM